MTNKLRTEVRIRLRNAKTIDLYNQWLASLVSQNQKTTSRFKQSQNEALEVAFRGFLEEQLLNQHFTNLEQRLFKVLQPINKRSRNNAYTYIDELAAVMLQRMVVNEKKLSFLINVVAEQTGMSLTTLNAPHEQMSNDLDWVRTLAKEVKKDYDIWCNNRKQERKRYED